MGVDAATTTVNVSIFSDNSGDPGSSLKSFTSPATISTTTQTEVEFETDDYRLNANTPYWIVIARSSATGTVSVENTLSDAEDAGAAAGWSIGNDSQLGGAIFADLNVVQFAVKGALSAGATDATLSNLEVFDTEPTLASLTPAFDPAITEYTAVVANEHTSLELDASVHDHSATVQFLDKNDVVIPTDNTVAPNISYILPNLDVGENLFKIKVTAEDGTTTKTYQVTVTRVDFLVSNAGSIIDQGFTVIPGIRTGAAIQFTTGSNPGGYKIDTVRLQIEVPAGTTPKVLIYTDSSGQPGASLKELTNPGAVPTTFAWADFDAGDYLLDLDTSYWIVIERASGTDSLSFRTTESTAEDSGTAPGWSIGDTVSLLDSGTWASSTGSANAIPQLAIKGEPATTTAPDAPVSLAASPGNTQVALTWTAPVSDGGAAITKYQYRVSDDGGATWSPDWTDVPDGSDAGADQADERTLTITGLTNGIEHTFQVRAVNSEGTGDLREATATPAAGPVLQSAEINAAELTLEFGNTLDASSRPAASSFVVKVRGAAVSLSSSNPVSISGSTVTLRLRSPVTAGDTVTVSYTEPATNPIKDGAAVVAPSFTDEPVTNNTPNAAPTGKPVISGTPQRDETLTVSTTGIRDDDGLSNPNFRYQWVRVEGATETSLSSGASYLLTRDDIGKQIKVIVAFRDDAGKYEQVESDLFPRSGTIQNKPNRQPTGRPTLSGTYQVGHTLTADTSGIDDQDGLTNPGYTYQWQRRESGVYTDISGATQMVYTLTPDDQGKRVRVQVTFNDDDENVHTLESSLSGVVQAQTSLPSSKVKVSLDATAYVVEEGDTIQVTVTLAEAPEDRHVIIPFTVTPANGAIQDDFTAWSSYTRQLRFDVGDTTDRINIRAADDTLNDDGETLTLCLGDLPEPYATLAGLDCATVNIADNDDPNSVRVTFRSDTYWASEDGNPAWPRISVHPVPDREITIPITFTRGGGLSEDDYSIVTTRVKFGPGLYGVHGDGHLSDDRTYASFPIEIWAIDDMEDDDGEYLDLAFGDLPPFVSAGGTGKFSYRPTTARVWFNDNEFTQVSVTDPPNPLGLSKRMRVTFADAELEAKEGLYETGSVATVRVQLSRYRNMESQVIIPIYRSLHGATDGVDFAAVPDHLIFLPGQTEQSFRVRAINDDIDDDGEYLTFSFGTLPELVYAGDQASTRVDLVDDDDPPVDVFFEQANYEVTNIQQDGTTEYARLEVKVKLSAAPERFIDVGIVPESIQGDGDIHFEYSAYIPRGPHSGAHFYSNDTEFTLQIYISARGGFDPNQTYRLSFKGMSYKMFVGSPATATITINPDP